MKTKLFSLIMIIALSLSLNAQQTDYCLQFDGVASRVKYTNDTKLQELDGATDYTIECWFYPTDADFHNKVLLKRYYQFAITMYQNNNYRIYFTHYSNNGNDRIFVNTMNNVFNLNQWNHVAVVNNSSDNTLRIYVNGVDVTLDDSGNPGPHSALTLEANPGTNANFYVGYGNPGTVPVAYIDKVRIKKTAEALADLNTSNVNLQPYTPNADTILLLNFNEGSGTTTVNDVNGVDAELQCRGGCSEIPTWHEIAMDMAVNNINNIDFNIYPNPVSNNYFSIQTDNEIIKNVAILDMEGKTVFRKNFDKEISNTEIRYGKLNPGLYLVKITTENGSGIKKLLIE